MRPRLPNSLRGRLMAIAAVTTVVAALLAAGVMAFTLQRFVTGQVDLRLDAQASSILSGLRRDAGDEVRLETAVDAPPFDRPNPGWFWQVEVHGEPRLMSGSRLGRGPLQALFDTKAPPDGRRPGPPLRSRPVDIADGEALHGRLLAAEVEGLPVAIVVTAPQRAIGGPMREALTPVVLSMAALGLALMGATWAQVRFGLKPLSDLSRDLAAVRNGSAGRIPLGQPDEIRPLAEELNILLDENAAGLERARRHVANLAHGLKTPLADLALTLDAPGRDPDGAARTLVDDMDRRVRHHLGRARASAVGNPARAATELKNHVDDLVAALSRIYRERGLAVAVAVPADLRVASEPQDLDEMAGNLLDNACKWARSKIAVSASTVEGGVELLIEDDGDGIGADEMPEALAPGRRLDEMQPGHGFGLSITRELAELYGGRVAIGRSPLGGLAARLLLPVPRA